MAERGGQPGNDNAAIGASIRDAIRYEVAKLGREIEGDDVALVKGMRAMAAKHVLKAVEGDLPTFKELADRLDGKATQGLDIQGELNVPLSGKVRFVKSGD